MVHQRTRGRPKAFHDTTEQNTIRSLDRAMTILKAVGDEGGATLSELADTTGQAPATVYRVLCTLALHDIVEADGESQVWNIGPGAFRIGSTFLRRTNVVERSRGPMEELTRDTGETANLGVERDSHVLFLTQVETHRAIRAFFPPGTKSEMHASGIGKALLSRFSEDRVDQIVGSVGLTRFTDSTITCRDRLRDDLAAAHQRGFAIDDQERAEGMRCVASAILDAEGKAVAGVSVSGPAFRITLDDAETLGLRVKAAAEEISRAIGGARTAE